MCVAGGREVSEEVRVMSNLDLLSQSWRPGPWGILYEREVAGREREYEEAITEAMGRWAMGRQGPAR